MENEHRATHYRLDFFSLSLCWLSKRDQEFGGTVIIDRVSVHLSDHDD